MIHAWLLPVLIGCYVGPQTQDVLAPSYNGVWVSRDGATFVIYSPVNDSGIGEDPDFPVRGFHLVYNDLYYTGGALRLVDNGGYYGLWQGTKRLPLKFESGDRLLSSPDYPTIVVPYAVPVFRYTKGENDSERGDLRLTFGPASSDGTVTSLVFNMRDAYEKTVYQDTAYFVGKSDKVSIAGTYTDRDFWLSLDEGDGRSVRTMKGQFRVTGTTYSLYGLRIWDRATFSLRDRDNGSEAGVGWIVWHPSPDFAKKLLNGDNGPVDQIDMYVRVRGLFTNGALRTLKRSQD